MFRSGGYEIEPLEGRVLLSSGDLDPTFGTGGEGFTNLIGTQPGEATALIVQPDGKIVPAGYAAGFVSEQPVVIRYLPDGTLDPSLGGGTGLFAPPVEFLGYRLSSLV